MYALDEMKYPKAHLDNTPSTCKLCKRWIDSFIDLTYKTRQINSSMHCSVATIRLSWQRISFRKPAAEVICRLISVGWSAGAVVWCILGLNISFLKSLQKVFCLRDCANGRSKNMQLVQFIGLRV